MQLSSALQTYLQTCVQVKKEEKEVGNKFLDVAIITEICPVMSLYTLQTKFWGYIGINLFVCLYFS